MMGLKCSRTKNLWKLMADLLVIASPFSSCIDVVFHVIGHGNRVDFYCLISTG